MGGASVPILVLILVFLNPEKAQIWLSLFFKLLSTSFGGARKRYLQLDLQGRVNDFARKLGSEAPFLATTTVRVEFSEGMDRHAFFDGDKVVLRLRRDDPSDQNFVHGAYLFVATSLLVRAKRYISPAQRLAVDLFVTTKLLNREKPTLTAHFLEEYVHPVTAKSKSKEGLLFEKFETIERKGHFYTLVLQELDLLGSKVFGRRADNRIVAEVNDFIDMLERFSCRKVGDEDDWNLVGEFCRMGLVIIGRQFNLTAGGDVYVRYLQRELIPRRIETVYLVGSARNRKIIDVVAAAVAGTYEVHRTLTYRTTLEYPDDRPPATTRQYLAVLRMKGASVFSESTRRRVGSQDGEPREPQPVAGA